MTGATYQESASELTDDYKAFMERIGILRDHGELNPIGFYPDNFTGIFWEKHLDRLINFCEKNIAYHIVTQTHPGRYENRFVPGCRTYFLADGDKNPNLVLNSFLRTNAELFSVDAFNKALAMIHEIDRCDKGK